MRFLKGQYSPDVGLLQESPTIRPNNYFLANDVMLAVSIERNLNTPGRHDGNDFVIVKHFLAVSSFPLITFLTFHNCGQRFMKTG